MMPELNFVSTNAQDTAGSKGLVQQPVLGTSVAGYNYGANAQPAGDGFMEFGTGTPGSLPFKVDQAGNVTAASVTNTVVAPVFIGKQSAPATPTGGGVIYVDTSGNLYYLSPGGTSTKLASD
jgi:hypothetical protein